MRNVSCLKNKNVVVIGLGITGQSCVRFLLQHQKSLGLTLSAMDTRALESIDLPIPVTLGKLDEAMLQQADVLVVSPGIALSTPAIAKAAQDGKILMGDIELFALFFNELMPNKSLLAVTGSNGKSTVVSLLQEIVTQSGLKPALGGNIGTPALQLLETHADADVFILELSSFQLESTDSLQADVACILNISDDHMDRYSGFDDYAAAKLRIYDNAKQVVCNLDDIHTLPSPDLIVSGISVQYFSAENKEGGWGLTEDKSAITYNGERFLAASEIMLAGVHNLMNIQAAAAMAKSLGIRDADIIQAVTQFAGLPHRCQKVSNKYGVDWINDSKATNVGATLAAVHGLRPTISGQLILLAGGDSKQADLSPLKETFEQQVDQLFLYGQDAPLLKQLKADAKLVADLPTAVIEAAKVANEGDAVLLSPACASLDMFRNYEHRGQCFIDSVEALS